MDSFRQSGTFPEGIINEITYQLAINPAHSATLINRHPAEAGGACRAPLEIRKAREFVANCNRTRPMTLTTYSDPMQTYIYYVAEKVPGALEMQRFAHPIHVGLVTAENHVEAYTNVLENLRPTFADAPQPLEVRFEVVMPPRAGNGVWRHGKPIDTDITFGDED